ncbi:MAG: cold-shock protein [Nitrospiraceae bacterium]|nr:MAG: cold-shock protein [Nitrospiraceae bacterium]
MAKREIGIVKWYDNSEGFGFIARRHGEDIYVHYSAILCEGSDCTPVEGDPVEFTVVEGGNGPEAQEVVVLRRQRD